MSDPEASPGSPNEPPIYQCPVDAPIQVLETGARILALET